MKKYKPKQNICMSKRMTNKQKSEINFLIKFGKINPTDQEIQSFIEATVSGKNNIRVGMHTKLNPLVEAKRKLDISIKMWKEDIKVGLLFKKELIEDFGNDEYFIKIIKNI